ncbi:MAG TPA: histidine phosphatase family protein, partial [Candidatus Dormibacteraeota bacterium]|nr:histidine phosphatase family protein [Candidatus Dormibacteraeota bacterium]
ARGEQNARELGARLRDIVFDVVYSSPMQRALLTAKLAGFEQPEVTALLKEFDYGEYEGLTTKQIHVSDPGWELYRDGCPGGETPEQVYQRATRFIDLVEQTSAEKVLAFGHGHILRAVAVAWIRAHITVATNLQLDVATVNILRDADHGRVIALWNAM